MKIGFDVDGVLADLMTVMCRKLREDYTLSISPNHMRTYDHVYHALPELSKKQINDYIFGLIYTEEVPTYPYVREVLLKMFKWNDRLELVTARPDFLAEATQKWVKKHIGLDANIAHIRSKDKAAHLKANTFDVFIEDRFRTANQIAEAGITSVLVNRPWNLGRKTHPQVIRINELIELQGILKEKKAA